MRIIKILLFILIIKISSYAQLNIGGNFNIDIYKPYTKETQDYLEINDQISSRTYHFHANYSIIEKGKVSWQTGFGYKHIEQIVRERIKSYYDYDPGSGTNYYKENHLDLKNKSISLAWKNDILFILQNKLNIKQKLGLSNELFFLERFRSGYFFTSNGKKFENNNLEIFTIQPAFFKFLASSANLSLFYRFTWQTKEKLSLGTKISLGTNLYSDWDQFQKYAWLGVGLELGFGKKKE